MGITLQSKKDIIEQPKQAARIGPLSRISHGRLQLSLEAI